MGTWCIRVSTEEQGHSGLGLAAQRATIEAEATRRGWTLVEVFTTSRPARPWLTVTAWPPPWTRQSRPVGGIVVTSGPRRWPGSMRPARPGEAPC
jgi:hypothetical protein